jgi:hypothetical protein
MLKQIASAIGDQYIAKSAHVGEAFQHVLHDLVLSELDLKEAQATIERLTAGIEHQTSAGLVRRDTSHLYPHSKKYVKPPLADPICDTWVATGREA